MRFETTVGSDGEISIPRHLLTELHLGPNMLVTVELSPASPPHKPVDREEFHKLVEELRGPMIAKMRADGYNSVDEYIDDIRGR